MANVIRYKTSQPTKRGLRKGNTVVGTGEENYGPTSTTGYVNGITPPDGGYVVYILSSNNDPAIYVANSDNDLIDIANTIGGSVSTVADAKTYLAGRANTWMLNSIPNNTATDGLIAHIQSNRLSSYPETGTTIYDLSGEGNNGTLQNGTIFNNGVWELDGVNDRVDIADPGYPSSGTDPFSIDITFMIPTGATWYINGSGTAIIGRGSYAGSLGIFRSSTEGRVSFWARLNGGNIYDPAVTGITRDKWHHIVGTFDGNDTAKIYHNGEYIAQEVNANNAGTFDADQYSIGGNTAFGGNNGQYGGIHIAEAKIYNQALSADEVSRNFYRGPIVTKDSSIFRHFTDTGNLPSRLNGTTLYDISGVSSDFTTEGTVTHDDSYGGVLHLNSGRIYRSQLGWYGKMATSWWMKYDGSISSGYFYTENYRGSGGCARIYSSINSNGTFTFQVWDNSSYGAGLGGTKNTTTTTNVCDGEWHHITCQWSNGSGNKPAGVYVYVDGQLEGYTYIIGNDGGYQHWHLGGSYGCLGEKSHNCYLGPIMFYKNYNLTDDEVLQNYNAHKARFGK